MGIKKIAKKASHKTKKATESATKDAEKTAKQTVKYAGKKYNQATGAIEDGLDKALDYSLDDLNTAANYAQKTWKAGTDWTKDLAEEAIKEAYRAIYKKYVDDYVKFVIAMGKAESKLFSKPTNILTEIRDSLLAGKFSSSMDNIAELLKSDVMKETLDAGHKLFGTSFVFAADLSFGVSGDGVTGGASGTIGISYLLDHAADYKYQSCVFAAAGGAIGATSSDGAGAEFGINFGFLAKDPTNISGWFVDVSGTGNMDNGIYGLGLSWSPPGKKPPYVKAEPLVGTGRVGLSTSEDASGSLTIGGSYTWLIQKVKNDMYMG